MRRLAAAKTARCRHAGGCSSPLVCMESPVSGPLAPLGRRRRSAPAGCGSHRLTGAGRTWCDLRAAGKQMARKRRLRGEMDWEPDAGALKGVRRQRAPQSAGRAVSTAHGGAGGNDLRFLVPALVGDGHGRYSRVSIRLPYYLLVNVADNVPPAVQPVADCPLWLDFSGPLRAPHYRSEGAGPPASSVAAPASSGRPTGGL